MVQQSAIIATKRELEAEVFFKMVVIVHIMHMEGNLSLMVVMAEQEVALAAVAAHNLMDLVVEVVNLAEMEATQEQVQVDLLIIPERNKIIQSDNNQEMDKLQFNKKLKLV